MRRGSQYLMASVKTSLKGGGAGAAEKDSGERISRTSELEGGAWSNGDVEGTAERVSRPPWARNIDRVSRRHSDHASRPLQRLSDGGGGHPAAAFFPEGHSENAR